MRFGESSVGSVNDRLESCSITGRYEFRTRLTNLNRREMLEVRENEANPLEFSHRRLIF